MGFVPQTAEHRPPHFGHCKGPKGEAPASSASGFSNLKISQLKQSSCSRGLLIACAGKMLL